MDRAYYKKYFTIEREHWWIKVRAKIISDRIGRLLTQNKNVNILNKSDWPNIISFFKQRIIALDLFWSLAKVTFEA